MGAMHEREKKILSDNRRRLDSQEKMRGPEWSVQWGTFGGKFTRRKAGGPWAFSRKGKDIIHILDLGKWGYSSGFERGGED